MALLPWQTATVVGIEDATYNTKRFFLQDKSIEKFDFKAGQFITLDLPIDEKINKRLRSYSIASNPDGSNILELLIVLNEQGKGTPYLFNEIIVGSEITYRGPLGVFTLPELVEKPLFLICTGTGIAPFRSMVKYLLANNCYKPIYLIYGSRTKADLLYYDELCDLQNRYHNFQYHAILSREEWEGKKGYVHEVYMQLCRDYLDANFYICGWKAMIEETKNKLLAMGYDKKLIHFEIYG